MTIRHDERIVSDLPDHFFESVQCVKDRLDRLSIEYRVIGSIGLAAHGILEPRTHPDATDPIYQVPDLDVILPRSELKGAREVRRYMRGQAHPLAVGLAVSTTIVDYRPDEKVSYLQWGCKSVGLNTKAFEGESQLFGGLELITVNKETLRHIYKSLPPRVKDEPALERMDELLGPDVEAHNDDLLDPFHQYAELVASSKPIKHYLAGGAIWAINKLPQALQGGARKFALTGASVLGMR